MKLSSLYRETNIVTENVQNNKEKSILIDNQAELFLVAAKERQPDWSNIEFNSAFKDTLESAVLPLIRRVKNHATELSEPIRPTIDTDLPIGNKQNNSRKFFPESIKRSEDKSGSNERSGSDDKSDSNRKSGSDGKSSSDGKSGSDGKSNSDGKSGSDGKSNSDGRSDSNRKSGSDGKSDSNNKSGSGSKSGSDGKLASNEKSGSNEQLSSGDETNSGSRSGLVSDGKLNSDPGIISTEPDINKDPDISFNTGGVPDPKIVLASNGGISSPQIGPSIISSENIPNKDPVSIISPELPGSDVRTDFSPSDSLSLDSDPTIKGVTPSIDTNNGLQNPSIGTLDEIPSNTPQSASPITSSERLSGQDKPSTSLPEETSNLDPTILVNFADSTAEYEESEESSSGNPSSLPLKDGSSSDNVPKISAQQNGQRSGSETAITVTASIIGILVFFTAIACIARFFIRKRRTAQSDVSSQTPLINHVNSISSEKSGSSSPGIPKVYNRQENTIFHDEERLRQEDMKKSYGRF